MWKCHKCGKPVYFAERKQSLGYDWHPECLRCEECSKRLNPGQHAEHKGEPYCHIPCYSVLFGPTLFGHGSQVEAHTSFGKIEKKLPAGIDRAILESKLKIYNQYYDGNSGQLRWKERNGKLILEGVLRIYWGVNNLIHLKENDDQRHHVQVRKRHSCREMSSTYKKRLSGNTDDQSVDDIDGGPNFKFSTLPNHKHHSQSRSQAVEEFDRQGVNNGLEKPDCTSDSTSRHPENGSVQGENLIYDSSLQQNSNNTTKPPPTPPEELCKLSESNNNECGAQIASSNESGSNKVTISSPDSFNGAASNQCTVDRDAAVEMFSDDEEVDRPKRERINLSRVQVRKLASSRSKTKLKRRCSINGHFYNRETKTFTPPYGTPTNVWVTSMVNTSEVINLLLDKFRVENKPEDFALFVVRDNGEIRRIKEEEYPLLSRVLLGPHEEVAKVFIMDVKQTAEISNEVAQYLNFQEPELVAILDKFYEEEDREVKKLKLKYAEMRRRIKAKLSTMIAA